MTKEELEKEAHELFSKAQQMLKKDGFIVPHIIADCTKLPQRLLLPMAWKNEIEKRHYYQKAEDMLKESGCTFYALVSDVWVVPDNGICEAPATDPARQPALMLQAEDFRGHKITLIGQEEGDPDRSTVMNEDEVGIKVF